MSRNDDYHHSKHRSSHSRDRDRHREYDRERDREQRSYHKSHHRDKSKTYHGHSQPSSSSRSSSHSHNINPFQQNGPQLQPPLFNRQQFPSDIQTFNLAKMSTVQPNPFALFIQPPNMNLFNSAELPGLPFPSGNIALDDKMISATALERLHLPQDRITDTGIMPGNPYYELPAGLMVPLVPAFKNTFEPINPKDLRLPFPKFPDENFLRMIDSYYHNDKHKRDGDGWDMSFIGIFLKQKEALAKMQSDAC